MFPSLSSTNKRVTSILSSVNQKEIYFERVPSISLAPSGICSSDSGSYYDSESDTTYYFVKGIVTSYSNHTKTFSLTSDVGETYELPADTDINITDYLNTEAHIWYSEDSQKNLKLLVFSLQIFWEHINELESEVTIPLTK